MQTNVHISKIERNTKPALEPLIGLSNKLHTTLDDLVVGEDQRSPADDLRLQLEPLSLFDDEDRQVVKAVLESLILKRNAKLAFADQIREAK